jgi:glycosyltransferase involved in cell wall biosynthesis
MSFITVIIPILNAMPYLPEALASLEAQTFKNFEVCLWDNGSTDGSVEEARRWISHRLPGRVVTGNPLPLHQCLARMVEEAKTEFVARMDGDDVCVPQRFEWQVGALVSRSELGIVGGQCPLIDRDGKLLGVSHPGPLSHDDILSEMMLRSALTHPALMFRREAILRAGNYIRPKPVEDLDLYLRMAGSCEFANLGQEILRYRIHPKSICQSDLEGQQGEMVDVVAQHAPAVYGMQSAQYRKLRAKKSFCAISLLLRSACYRSRGDVHCLRRIIFSPSFIGIGRCLTGARDYTSKIAFRVLEAFDKRRI